MDFESLIRLYGPLGAFVGLYILLLRWVLKNAERTIAAHLMGAEAARASTDVMRRHTDAIEELSLNIRLLHKSVQTIERGQRAWSRKSSS